MGWVVQAKYHWKHTVIYEEIAIWKLSEKLSFKYINVLASWLLLVLIKYGNEMSMASNTRRVYLKVILDNCIYWFIDRFYLAIGLPPVQK